ncbi:MAG: tetratricopeptide repeat protein [Vicingaceae bacterium]
MKTYIFILLSQLFSIALVANNSSGLQAFKAANKLYEEGKYQNASEQYNQLIDKGYISDDIHYNLANSYFKMNDIAPAILNYEKALKINPNNKDAANNLALANEKTVDKIEQVPELFFYRWIDSILNIMSLNAWSKLSVVLFFLAFICFALYLFTTTLTLKKVGFYAFSIMLILGFTSWLMAAKQKHSLEAKNYAIVMNPTVNIVSSPSKGSSQLFVLHEGSKVKIKEETEDWFRVALPNGNEGWIDKVDVEVV